MFFKLKNIPFVQLFTYIAFWNVSAYAENPALRIPTGTLAAMSNAGAAASGDQSVVDINPAILPALKKQYTLFGNTAFQNQFNLIELGIFDSKTSAFSAVVKARETLPDSSTTRDRRATLGLAYQIPDTHLSFGLSGDYELIDLSSNFVYSTVNSFMGAGVLYQWSFSEEHSLFLGASLTRLFDRVNPSVVDLGISTALFKGFYTFSLDALLNNISGTQSFAAGLNIAANEFLDIRGSFGYNPKDQNTFWGAGVFFNAPILHLYYTVSLFDTNVVSTTSPTQTAGLALVF